MREEDRIIDIDEIGRWPGFKCYIKPKYCAPGELEEHVMTMYRKFYSYPAMLKRLPMPLNQSRIALWIVSLSHRKISRGTGEMENFDEY
jgi:hypothetical protein